MTVTDYATATPLKARLSATPQMKAAAQVTPKESVNLSMLGTDILVTVDAEITLAHN